MTKWNKKCRFFDENYACDTLTNEGYENCEQCKFASEYDKKILIIKLGALGDVLRTTPILHALREKYPNCLIYWLTLEESEELLKNNINIPQIKNDCEITSYSTFNNNDYFIICYYIKKGDFLDKSLHLIKYEKDKKKFHTNTYDLDTIEENTPSILRGSVTKIIYTNNLLSVHLHINPSAGYSLYFNDNNKYLFYIFGWPVFQDTETVIYQKSQIHFAPTHFTELYGVNILTKQKYKLYPSEKKSIVRIKHEEQIKKYYEKIGEDWFRINNHHMNPEDFDNGIIDKSINANHDLKSIIFIINFANIDNIFYWKKNKEMLEQKGITLPSEKEKQVICIIENYNNQNANIIEFEYNYLVSKYNTNKLEYFLKKNIIEELKKDSQKLNNE